MTEAGRPEAWGESSGLAGRVRLAGAAGFGGRLGGGGVVRRGAAVSPPRAAGLVLWAGQVAGCAVVSQMLPVQVLPGPAGL